MKRIAILGAGGMGTALAFLFAKTGHEVRLYARNSEAVEAMRISRENARHLPGVILPEEITILGDAGEATSQSDLIVVAIPSSYLRSTLIEISSLIPQQIPVLSVVKGIENGTFARPSHVIIECLGQRSVSVLSGPSHAEELARGLPASVVVAGEDEQLGLKIRHALNHSNLRVYTNSDAVGVELAGALKNILGLAAGICGGLGFGDNAKAALLTRGLVEIAKFGVQLGGNPQTFGGLAGVGDVMTTCFSPFGRNRALGEAIGRGATLEEALHGMVNVAEGVSTTRSVYGLSRREGIEMPITDEVYQILFEGKSPRAAVSALMDRAPKDEWPMTL